MTYEAIQSIAARFAAQIQKWKAIAAIVAEHPEWREQDPRLASLLSEDEVKPAA